MEEGNILHPRCPQCDMLVTWSALNRMHLATSQCAKGAEMKCRRLVEEELRESLKRAFQAYGEQLETFTSFKYLGRVLIVGDGSW